jgi:type IV pilus assembly protein PilQ
MVKSKTGRFRGVAAIACGALALVGLFACATSPQSETSARPERIADVLVERDGDATVVTLTGLDDPVFTAFEQPDPARIIVDLSEVESDVTGGPVVVYDGLVEEITMSPYATGGGEAMTRVEISMASPATFEVTNTDAGLRIWMGPAPFYSADDEQPDEASLDDTAAEGLGDDAWAEGPTDPWAIDPMSQETGVDGPEDSMAMAEDAFAVPEPAVVVVPATKLLAVNVQETGEGTLIEISADGSIGNMSSFTLAKPDRLVVDLPGLRSEVADERVAVGSSLVERIRVGQHDDMVRVVIDSGSASQPFEGRRMGPGSTGLWIALGSGDDLDFAYEAATAAPPPAGLAMSSGSGEAVEMMGMDSGMDAENVELAESDAPAATEVASTETSTVYGIEFDVQETRDRLVVLGDKPLDYLVYEPDQETFVLSISGAEIEPEAAVRIAPEVGGPVSLVTAFAQPEVETSEVRVVVKRAVDLKPEISRRGSLLIIDFPHTGGVAATPPVLETPPGETLLGDPSDTQVVAMSEAGAVDLGGASPPASPDAMSPDGIPMAGTEIDLGSAPMGGGVGPASLEPPASIDILQEGGLVDGKEYIGRRISLDFKEVDIADVLRLIAEVSDLNVIAGDEVKGRVTIRLVDVPWDQALDIILLTKGLGFMRIGNVLRIAPSNVIVQEEEARLQERRAKERLEDLVVKLQPVNYADAKSISKMVKELLTERGTVNVDTRTNTLVLKDIPSVIDEATALVKAIDTQTPQVMIEAKVVEAKLQFSREFGSVWSVGVQPLSDAWDDSSPFRQDIGADFLRLRPSQLPGADGATNGAVFANPITTLPTAMANMGAFLLDEKINLDLQLQAAEVNGDGKVISSPRVVTLDNSKAKIAQGVSIPFQTFENGDAQLEFVDAVLQLDVTPHITANKAIIMKVKVTRNAPDDSVFTMTGSPAIAKNEVDTETLVKDGQTLVLGGIYTIGKSQRHSAVPYLSRIPILGGAFRNDEVSDDRQELLIFVTPRIVQGDEGAS